MKCRKCSNKVQKHGGGGLCSVHYRRKLAYRGEPQGWVDPSASMEHIRRLREHGMTLKAIGESIGQHEDSVRMIAKGGRKKLRAATEAKLLEIQPWTGVGSSNDFVPTLASMRMIRALAALGYSFAEQGRRIGMHRQTLCNIAHGRNRFTERRVADAVQDLFTKLQYAPPEDSPFARKARTIARRNGWTALPMDWDEDELTHLDAKPKRGSAIHSAPKWVPDYEHLKSFHKTDEEIARRLNLNLDSMRATIRRRKERAA